MPLEVPGLLEVPYLVVGAGPVGLTAARLLAKAGQHCLIVERRDGPQRLPAAHVVNGRSLEIFRQAGLDMDAILSVGKDPADAGHVNYVTRLSGQLIGRLPFERQGPEVFDLTPTPLRNISQHRLEPILAGVLEMDPAVDLRYDTEWQSSAQDDDGVTSIIRDLDTNQTTEVRSQYVLACDGAASRVRQALSIDMIGPPVLRSLVAIHFAADLRSMISDRLGVLHFVMDPAVNGTFIAHDIDREWVFMVGFDAEQEAIDDYDTERCLSIVRAALGDDTVPVEILNAGTWHMSAQVAERTRDRRIFLVGDSAHRFPPTGGLGLNTGVADAHNLVWKLVAVGDGWADASILDSYEQERRPIAEANCEQSTTNASKLVSLVKVLGQGSPTTEGMLAVLADPTQRDAIDAAVLDQATHFDMIGLQLGYCYNDGAIARGAEPLPPIEDPRVFDPHGEVGTRLPHAWLGDGRSTLDVVADSGLTLLTTGDHDRWATTFGTVGVPLHHVRIGIDTEVLTEWITMCGVGENAALLVRPDQHIAWRSNTTNATDSARDVDVDNIIARILGPQRAA